MCIYFATYDYYICLKTVVCTISSDEDGGGGLTFTLVKLRTCGDTLEVIVETS